MLEANANPEKRYFIDLVTRDISLEDAILDLIDNSIDSLVRTKQIDIYRDFVNKEGTGWNMPLAEIHINFSPNQFKIEDNCGGISFNSAKNDVFRFGRPDPHRGVSLSVFGIGMKRAIFKIGRRITIESHTEKSGFSMHLDVDDWLKEETPDWKIPLEELTEERSSSKTGTKIIIDRIREEISTLTKNPVFSNRLIKTIQETYPFYLGRYISIFVNSNIVEGKDLFFAVSDEMKIQPSIDSWEDGNVKATMICGLLPREEGKWTFDKSGWYLVCNGRVVVYADKTQLTGWGRTLPQFMPKNRGFVGIVFFKSDYPEELPWNTTKRGIDTESAVYIRTRTRMIPATKSVLTIQNKLYDSKDGDTPNEEYRDSIKDLPAFSATKQAAERNTKAEQQHQAFLFDPPVSRSKMTNIQFKVKEEDIVRVKKRLGRSSMPNYEVGEIIFKYFLDRECS